MYRPHIYTVPLLSLCLSEDLLSLPRPPGRTLVVGADAEGLECAGFLSGLGMPVTVLPQPDLLRGFDQKIAQKLENHMLLHGVDFLYNHSITKVLGQIRTLMHLLY